MNGQPDAQPLLREWLDGSKGSFSGFWQEWYCDPPPSGVKYRVHPGGDDWTTVTEDGRQIPVRRIREIELSG